MIPKLPRTPSSHSVSTLSDNQTSDANDAISNGHGSSYSSGLKALFDVDDLMLIHQLSLKTKDTGAEADGLSNGSLGRSLSRSVGGSMNGSISGSLNKSLCGSDIGTADIGSADDMARSHSTTVADWS